MSNLTNEVKRKAKARAKIEMDIEAYLASGGCMSVYNQGTSGAKELSQREASVLAFKHNTANKVT